MPSIAITQPYEAVYIMDPDLGDERISAITAKYRAIIETGGGTLEKIDVWERRRLAYEIKGRTEGIYVVMQFRSKPDVEAELRRIFQISEDQIRYLIIRRDDAEELLPVATPGSRRTRCGACPGCRCGDPGTRRGAGSRRTRRGAESRRTRRGYDANGGNTGAGRGLISCSFDTCIGLREQTKERNRMDLNRVILIGRLANDPELKYTPSGIAVTSFRLAVNRPMSAEAKTSGQEKQADFFNIAAWRQSAEFAAQWLSKGRLVAIEGRLQVREYVTQDGQKRRDYEVVAENLKSLDRPKDEEGGSQNGNGYSAGGRGGRSDYADADPGGDTGYGDDAPAPPPPARAPTARPAAAPARPASANNAAPRPAAGGSRYQAPPEDDMDDPFADN